MMAKLGEGKLWHQNSTALQPYPLMGKALGVNPEEKPGVGSPLDMLMLQHPSGNSCNASGSKLYWPSPFLYICQLHGKGEPAAWATAVSPHHFA